jgi:formylglycine-generating enzyme required for sulfatase activity
MARIFISYRRSDSNTITGRIYDRLKDAFGEQEVFRDFDLLYPGDRFPDALDYAVNHCDVMLVVIGREWLTATQDGQRRLDSPTDFVRMEVEAGLRRDDVRVIPVLVNRASMPDAELLPDSLKPLTQRQAVVVRDDPDFHRDMDRFIKYLESLLASPEAVSPSPNRWAMGISATVIAVIAVGLIIAWLSGAFNPSSVTIEQSVETEMAAMLRETVEYDTRVPTMTAAVLTLTATHWTPTPTPDARQTAEARFTMTRVAAATQAMLDQTETATLWTPTSTSTPTPTFTSAPTLDPLDMTFEAGDSNDLWTPIEREFGDDPFVFVPAGCFMMGSTDEQFEAAVQQCVEGASEETCRHWFDPEQPDHRVCLSPFWIGQTEVTNAQYQRCVDAGECEPSSRVDDSDFNAPDQPVGGVNWDNAQAYADWLSAETGATCSLPTEAQWEYAARGPQAVEYPWGDESPTCEFANYYGCVGRTSPVGSYSLAGDSWVGAADMAGNIWEWTADYWLGDYDVSEDGQLDPMGPDSGDHRVVRGGSWNSSEGWVRSAFRLVSVYYASSRSTAPYFSFRVACGVASVPDQ